MCAPVSSLVAGLGNPGDRYARTRHNAGFRTVDRLAGDDVRFRRAGPSLVLDAEIEGCRVMLAKPLTWMNNSGAAVRFLLERYGLTPERLVLVLDDFSLPFGRIRIRPRGSAGGHNGLESVIEVLGTDAFARVRIGIGEDSMPADRSEFVLEEWPPERQQAVEEMIARSADAVRAILRNGVAKTMAQYNG